MQATHLVSCALLSTMHVSHCHAPSALLNMSPKEGSAVGGGVAGDTSGLAGAKCDAGIISEALTPVPGLAVSHATHFTTSALFWTRHVSQSHIPAGRANIVPKPTAGVAAVLLFSVVVEFNGLKEEEEEEKGEEEEEVVVVAATVEDFGGCDPQATHLASDCLFCTRQTSQLQEPAGGLNRLPKPAEEEREGAEEKGAVDTVELDRGALLALGELEVTGEAKSGEKERKKRVISILRHQS